MEFQFGLLLYLFFAGTFYAGLVASARPDPTTEMPSGRVRWVVCHK